jgi:hypothetical protein
MNEKGFKNIKDGYYLPVTSLKAIKGSIYKLLCIEDNHKR